MITANELKVKGVKAIEEQLANIQEVGISVRGKVKYVAMTIEQFEKMRAIELEYAYEQCKKDIAEGRFTTSIDDHFIELDKLVQNV